MIPDLSYRLYKLHKYEEKNMNEEKQYQYQCNTIDAYEYNDTYDYDEQINYLESDKVETQLDLLYANESINIW